MLPRGSVWTSAVDYTDRLYLDHIGTLSGLSHTHAMLGGPRAASWSLSFDPVANHRALQPGRLCGISLGGFHVWQGKVVAPQRGRPWTFEADGLGALAENFRAFAPTSGNAFAANEVVTNAQTRGWPVLSYAAEATFSTLTANTTETANGDPSVADVLTKVTDRNGQAWRVKERRLRKETITLATPTHLLYATQPAEGRTLDDLPSALLVRYTNSMIGSVSTAFVRSTGIETRFGVVEEQVLDLTSEASMTTAAATAIGTAKLSAAVFRARFGGSFTVTHGQLTTLGGQPVCLASVQSPMVCQVVLTDPDRRGELTTNRTSRFVVGTYSYDWDSGVATVTPADSTPKGLLAALRKGKRARVMT